MRIDCFICNPPYGTTKNPSLCNSFLRKMKNKRTVVICPPAPVFCVLYFHITNIEVVNFPGIKMPTIITTINDNKTILFEKKYRYKTSRKPTMFYILNKQIFAGSSKTKYGLKVRKIGIEKECKNKIYLDINDEERLFINKLVDDTNMDFWVNIYKNSMNGPRFLVPNLLAKTKYAYLVEEVKQ